VRKLPSFKEAPHHLFRMRILSRKESSGCSQEDRKEAKERKGEES
jgi:hypothetical protein